MTSADDAEPPDERDRTIGDRVAGDLDASLPLLPHFYRGEVAQMNADLRQPAFEVSWLEALSRRIRRVYALLFTVMGIAWGAKVTLFTPESQWQEAAELPGIPGTAVAATLVVWFVLVYALALWPSDRRAKGEIYGVRVGQWNDDE